MFCRGSNLTVLVDVLFVSFYHFIALYTTNKLRWHPCRMEFYVLPNQHCFVRTTVSTTVFIFSTHLRQPSL